MRRREMLVLAPIWERMMKATIKITKGASGWWLTPEGWQENDRTPLDLESESADDLRRTIIKRSFNLYRWGGEEGPHGPVSVGFHSLLVSFLAGRLAEARDCSDEIIRCAKSYGALHDMGERGGGIGDVVSPILHAYPGAKEANEDCQAAAHRLFKPWLPTLTSPSITARVAAWQIAKDADHLAASLERRYLFDDDSGDCEAPDIEAMANEIELGAVNVGNYEDGDMWMELEMDDCIQDIDAWPELLESAIKCAP